MHAQKGGKMNKEALYKYLTAGQEISCGQRKLVKNVIDYAEKLPAGKERADFLNSMLKDTYGDNGPKISEKTIAGLEKEMKIVRVKRVMREVRYYVSYKDVRCPKEMSLEEAIESVKDSAKNTWKISNVDQKIERDNPQYIAKELTEQDDPERQYILDLIVECKDPETGKVYEKRFGDLKKGDIVFNKAADGYRMHGIDTYRVVGLKNVRSRTGGVAVEIEFYLNGVHYQHCVSPWNIRD